jgi:hypothetical protein
MGPILVKAHPQGAIHGVRNFCFFLNLIICCDTQWVRIGYLPYHISWGKNDNGLLKMYFAK